jgi:hypothetical protein
MFLPMTKRMVETSTGSLAVATISDGIKGGNSSTEKIESPTFSFPVDS